MSAEHIVSPYNGDRIKHGGYELSMGGEYYTTSDISAKKQILALDEQLVISPGQFGILLTEEKINVPIDSIAFISIKASIKFRGLINVSGFHVDPGFKGHLKFSVYNAGSQKIVVTRGAPLFIIWFANLDQDTSDIYNGGHAGQKEVSAEDVMRIQGEVASPSALNERLKNVERSINFIKTLAWGIGVTFVITVLGGLIVNAIWKITGTEKEEFRPRIEQKYDKPELKENPKQIRRMSTPTDNQTPKQGERLRP